MTMLLLVKQCHVTSHLCITATAYVFFMILKTDELKYVKFYEFWLLWSQGAIKEHLLKSYHISDTMLKISDVSSHFILIKTL